jgi:CheY-like chemotaxis protein
VTWDGFQVIEWLRQTGSAGIAPVIILTSDDIQEHRTRALAVGVAALFQKPVSVPDLMETVEECSATISQTR